jgi:uncharacterized membrane protein
LQSPWSVLGCTRYELWLWKHGCDFYGWVVCKHFYSYNTENIHKTLSFFFYFVVYFVCLIYNIFSYESILYRESRWSILHYFIILIIMVIIWYFALRKYIIYQTNKIYYKIKKKRQCFMYVFSIVTIKMFANNKSA